MKHTSFTFLFLITVTSPAFGQAPSVPVNVPLQMQPANAPVMTAAPDIVAEVNYEKITQPQLAAECLQLHGEKELLELIYKTLIRLECERQHITITAEEINAEILRMARMVKMDSEQWLQVLAESHNISPEQYRQDIVWRILALAKLAGAKLAISPTEVQAEFDKQYGPAVQVRQIVLDNKADADSVRNEVIQHPETFAAIAKNKSKDPVRAPYGGMLHPIRRGTYNPGIESILFAMKPGDVSQSIEFPAGIFTIYRCEGHLQPVDVDVESVKGQLLLKIRDEKLPKITEEIFVDLKNKAKVQIVFGSPVLNQQYPGVAALLNGKAISLQELADLCVLKHGREALKDMIHRRIIEQACRRETIVISEQDISKEIQEMAFNYLPLLPNGAADVEGWLRRATEESGLSIPMYRKTVVVPMLSLKRLTRPYVSVTEEEIQRSYEANYGKKIQCLAIFFNANDQRRATEVWNIANRQNTEENFGDLAKRYSLEPESQLNSGVIPPISRHSGHPRLEEAAFALKPGEVSHIVQVEDCLVILYCVKIIEPLPGSIEDVRVDLITDIFEKKQRIIAAQYFAKLSEQAVWADYLSGTSHNHAVANVPPTPL